MGINKLIRLWLPPVIWMGLIFALSAVPGLNSGLPNVWDWPLRKLAHLVEFAVLAGLFVRALKRKDGQASWNVLGAAFVLTVLYALTDEWHQRFVADRVGSEDDVLIDSVGALVGSVVAGWRFWQYQMHQNGRA